MKIDGKKIAHTIISTLKKEKKPRGILAAVLVGDDKGSRAFLRQKRAIADELGIEFRLYEFDATIAASALRKEVSRISKQKAVGGVVVQLPLPAQFRRQSVLNTVDYGKDIDCLTSRMVGDFYHSRSPILPPAVGATRASICEALGSEDALPQKRVFVIGCGVLVGRPVSNWLLGRVGELTVFDIHASNLREKLDGADIIISGAGVAGLFSAHDIRQGAIVIDFGYDGGRGDFESADAEAKDISYTPTPGGTGQIVVAQVFENFYALNRVS